ncbi:MAG: hypothetical protein IT489_05465 [Gammaproteobacteria bacterium]|nr:hypothetical protein [Gammaproteobacteria bacterium]
MRSLSSTVTLGIFAGALLCADIALAADSMAGMTGMGKRMAMDPAKAEIVPIDRFSDKAGHLQLRTAANGLPGPNEPVDFDQGPFITQGIAPDGGVVKYYNFDVQSTKPAQIYILVRENDGKPVTGQLHIVDAIPGEPGYNDFRRINRVKVPQDYTANSVTSLDGIRKAGYATEPTDTLVNYPLVPDGSKASHRLGHGDNRLHSAWYRGKIVKYFAFDEKELSSGGTDTVPVSPIYVTFNVNPDQPGGGPGSGFKTEPKSMQTHNVPLTIPSDMGYSPLWLVSVYDNSDWSMVRNLSTVLQAKVLAPAVATVNCPIVHVGSMDEMKM